MRALCTITIDGVDVSSNIAPRLLRLSTSDRAGGESGTASLELEDSEGRVLLPKRGVVMAIALGWEASGLATVFTGKVDQVRSKGDGGGTTLTIGAKEMDVVGKAKNQQLRHFDDKSVRDILKEAGADADVTEIRIDQDLGDIVLPYEMMSDESFAAFGMRLAKQLGASFKVVNGRATMTARNGGGMPFPTIEAAWGKNLLSWDIAPFVGRPSFKSTRVRYHDPKTGKTKEERVETEIEGAEAEHVQQFSSPDAASAKRRAQGAKAENEREGGEGTVTIIGDVMVQPEAEIKVVGARPGVDGAYRVDGYSHEYSQSGFTTRIEIKRPSGAAGKDDRGAKTS